MYCNKCGEPIKNNTQVCPYCGATQPKQEHAPVQVDFSQFQAGAEQTVSRVADKDDSHYVRDSILLLIVCLLYGVIRTMAGFSSGDATNTYKGIIACAASLIFIPQIKIGVNNPVVSLLIKILIAGAVVIII